MSSTTVSHTLAADHVWLCSANRSHATSSSPLHNRCLDSTLPLRRTLSHQIWMLGQTGINRTQCQLQHVDLINLRCLRFNLHFEALAEVLILNASAKHSVRHIQHGSEENNRDNVRFRHPRSANHGYPVAANQHFRTKCVRTPRTSEHFQWIRRAHPLC